MGGVSYQYNGDGNRVQQDALNYILDLQPGLALVIGDSDGNRYIHSRRGVHAVNDGSMWQYPLTDALGSVRGYTNAHSNVLSNVNYTPIGVPDTNITCPAFTGEWRSENETQYHRARHLSPGLGVWLSLDPFEGVMKRPMSLNGYSWVESNPIMNADPSGFSHVHIWASAFIMPEQIEFPYVDPFSGYDDFSAIWKGDGREFYSGGPVPDNNARVYFNVEFDWTNLSNNLTNDAGTNVTEVTHRPWATLGMPVTEFKKAPDPSVATINCDEVHGYSVVYVEFEADGDSGKNPLVPFAPAIEMHYRIWIAPRGVVRIMRTIDRYPWHELFIEIDGIPVVELRKEPPGPTITPLDLALEGYFDDFHISFEGGSDERCSDTLSLCQRLQLEDSCCNLP